MKARKSLLAQAEDALDSGDFARARTLSEESLLEADGPRGKKGPGERDPSSRAEARRLLALSLLYSDRADEAEKLAHEAIRIARAAGAKKETALAELAVAEVLRSRGDYVAGLTHAGRARSLAEKAGEPRRKSG